MPIWCSFHIKKFVKRIKNRYIVSEPDPAIPQQRSIQKSTDPARFINKASKVLQCDLEKIKDCARISESDKLNRDILLYWLWREGKYTNLQIGNLFGLTHSSVSRRVAIIRKKMALEQDFQRRVETIKSQIKPWPHFSDSIFFYYDPQSGQPQRSSSSASKSPGGIEWQPWKTAQYTY